MQQNVLFTLKAQENLEPYHGTARSRNAPLIASLQAFDSLIQTIGEGGHPMLEHRESK